MPVQSCTGNNKRSRSSVETQYAGHTSANLPEQPSTIGLKLFRQTRSSAHRVGAPGVEEHVKGDRECHEKHDEEREDFCDVVREHRNEYDGD